MTREHLDNLLSDLKAEIIVLEQMVRQATLDSVEALMTNNMELSAQVYANDKLINEKRFDIENECLITIATQQPMARDLRVLASILEIVTELERIGDYAKGIAKINRLIGKKDMLPAIELLPEMAQTAANMMQQAVKAFEEGDVESARNIPNLDDRVDEIFNIIYRGLVEQMIKESNSIDVANHLQWAAHNLERMADRVTNICERTIFIETGSIYELEESDDESLI
ncbi:MAG: phosphate signaling complex protein PhoU [Chloroflexota bacterium]